MSKEYIEHKQLQDRAFGNGHPTFFDGEDRADWYKKCIKEAPVADVVEIVRCIDCKHYDINSFGQQVCTRTLNYFCMNDNDFCSYGDRKD